MNRLTVWKICTHLAVWINVVLEVVVFAQHRFGDEVLIADTHSRGEGSIGGVSQPSDLGGLLIVCVLQVQTPFQR